LGKTLRRGEASRTKDGSHGRWRARRRRGGRVLLVLVVALVVGLATLPLARQVPDMVRREVYPLRYEETIREASRKNDLEPAFVAGIVYTESRFRPDAESYREAYGLMQLLPDTAVFVGEKAGIEGDYRDPEVNLRLGTWYLGYLEEKYEGDERLMLAAYNSGEGQVDEWVSEGDFDVETDIPFEETRQYVERVLQARETYRDLYGSDLRKAS
jgi:soluble lytic murein transglycosylase